jgi:methylmalonyl-CoA/ethylmalonyl-CoA epimerase
VTQLVTLHHLGIVVKSIEESVEGVCASMNARWTFPISADPIQKVRVTFLEQNDSTVLLELIEPASETSPVTKFLAAGGGLHHVCYEVDDLDAHIAAMKKARSALIRSPQPAVAFELRRIAWMLTPQRVLVEYLERVRSSN